jgi:drug/metabolite transporter (DMT)-like permease
LALLISLAGLVLILFPQELTFKNSHFAGLLLGTASAVLFASEIIAKKKLALKHKGDVVTVWFFSLSILLLVFFASPESVSEMNIQNWLTLLVYGIITSTGISLFISGTKETKAQHIGVLSYLEPLGAIIWGILLLSEGLTIFTFLGGTMILSSGYLIIRQNPVPKKYAVN